VVRLVARQALVIVLVGGVVGVAAAAFGSRLLASLLYGIQPIDPVSFGAGLLILGATALLATVMPAAQAANIDPAITLRSE
jgi:putative ABC transport system permease protein